jgi:hypothetical protein
MEHFFSRTTFFEDVEQSFERAIVNGWQKIAEGYYYHVIKPAADASDSHWASLERAKKLKALQKAEKFKQAEYFLNQLVGW